MRAKELPPPVRTDPTSPVRTDPTSPVRTDRMPSLRTARAARTARTARTVRGSELPAEAGPLVLDRYRLRRRLGSGAFGSVWQASDERLHRDVAVKLLPRERIAGGRFEREARAAARLAHPGIVTLYEAAVDDEGAYLVSELVRGATLARLLEDGRLSDRTIVRIGIALCGALAHAHAQGVVHRDVKPSNVLIPRRPTSSDGIAKLTDFGVARLIGGNPLTRTGDVIGTAAYMAPEQAEGRPADAGADLYSLAIVLYEALTGVNPLATAPRTRRLGTYLPPLRRQRRDLPRALGQAIDQALRPRLRERGTLAELSLALERSIHEVEDRPGIVGSPTLWPSAADRTLPASTRVALPATADWEGPAPPATAVWEAPEAAGGAPAAEASPPKPATLPRPAPPRWAARALGGATAAGLAAWLVAYVLPHPPLTPAAAALTTALLVTLLPRLGWLALAALATVLLATQGRTGAALLIGIAMLFPARTAPLAPALGAVGLAGAWPALAGNARTTLRRAVLGAAGWIWLALIAPLAHKSLYTRLSTAAPAHWVHSASAAASHVLSPLLHVGTLTTAVIWAAGAAILPLARRPRLLAAELAAVSAWSIVLTTATSIAYPSILPGMAVLGAVAAVVFTLASDVTSRLRKPTRGEDLRSMEPR